MTATWQIRDASVMAVKFWPSRMLTVTGFTKALRPYPQWCTLSILQTPLRVLIWILSSAGATFSRQEQPVQKYSRAPPYGHLITAATLFWPKQKLSQSLSSSTVHPEEQSMTLNIRSFPTTKAKSNLLALEWFLCILRVPVRESLRAGSPWGNSRGCRRALCLRRSCLC